MTDNNNSGIAQLVDKMNADLNAVQQDLIKLLGSNVKLEGNPNPARVEQQLQDQSRAMMGYYQEDIQRGVQCYLDFTHDDEKRRLGETFGKLQSLIQFQAGLGPSNPLVDDDYAFLDAIATRALQDHHFKEASCMFRLIIQLDLFYSRGWVGWACSEQEMHHIEVVDQIYSLAATVLPADAYIAAFASDFYFSENNRSKSVQVLRDCIDHLNQLPEASADIIRRLNQMLATR